VLENVSHQRRVVLARQVGGDQVDEAVGVQVARLRQVERGRPQHRPGQWVLDIGQMPGHGRPGQVVEPDPRERLAPAVGHHDRTGPFIEADRVVAQVDQPRAHRPQPVVVRRHGEAVRPDPLAAEHRDVAVAGHPHGVEAAGAQPDANPLAHVAV
jgi:hypothetical protein